MNGRPAFPMRRESMARRRCAPFTSTRVVAGMALRHTSQLDFGSQDYGVPSNYELLESIPDAVVVTDPDGGIVYANRKAGSISGYKRSELIGRKVELLVPLGMRRRHVEHRRDFYHRGVARLMGTGEHDFTLRRKDGTSLEVEISLGPAGHDTIAVVRDVTERHLLEEALEHRALHDPLTDLANRILFFDRLHQAIYSARRDGSSFAIVLLDVDGFKAVNDRYGHAAGDEVLRQLSTQLRRGLRATDTAARIWGGRVRVDPAPSRRPARGSAHGSQAAGCGTWADLLRSEEDRGRCLSRHRDVSGRRAGNGQPHSPRRCGDVRREAEKGSSRPVKSRSG